VPDRRLARRVGVDQRLPEHSAARRRCRRFSLSTSVAGIEAFVSPPATARIEVAIDASGRTVPETTGAPRTANQDAAVRARYLCLSLRERPGEVAESTCRVAS